MAERKRVGDRAHRKRRHLETEAISPGMVDHHGHEIGLYLVNLCVGAVAQRNASVPELAGHGERPTCRSSRNLSAGAEGQERRTEKKMRKEKKKKDWYSTHLLDAGAVLEVRRRPRRVRHPRGDVENEDVLSAADGQAAPPRERGSCGCGSRWRCHFFLSCFSSFLSCTLWNGRARVGEAVGLRAFLYGRQNWAQLGDVHPRERRDFPLWHLRAGQLRA